MNAERGKEPINAQNFDRIIQELVSQAEREYEAIDCPVDLFVPFRIFRKAKKVKDEEV